MGSSEFEDLRRALGDVLRGPMLDNFSGYVSALFVDNQGSSLPLSDNNLPLAKVDQPCKLIVSIQTAKPDEENSEHIEITDGSDVERVSFVIELISDSLRVEDSRKMFTLSSIENAKIDHSFEIVPEKPKQHIIHVRVYQKNRFIQAVKLLLEVVK